MAPRRDARAPAIEAVVFIECTPGTASRVADAVRRLPGVAACHAVTGAYDLIALVGVRDLRALGRCISGGVHRVPHVVRTTTSLVIG